MADYSTLLKTWGDTGTAYPSGYSYLEGEQPVDDWDNFLKYNVIEDLKHLISLTNERVETDKGASTGLPTNPETAHLYYDEDSERLSHYDATAAKWRPLMKADGDTMTGVLDMGGYALTDSMGTLSIPSDVNVQNSSLGVGMSFGNAVYATLTDVPTLSAGEQVYVSGENALYIEDGN
jgi:hypothetical protein